METTQTHLQQGHLYGIQGKWDSAIDCYQKAIELEVNQWAAYHHLKGDFACGHYYLGETLSKLERWDEAIASC